MGEASLTAAEVRPYAGVLRAFECYCGHLDRPVALDALLADLPVASAGGVTEFTGDALEPLFIQLADRAGFAARLVHKPMDQLSALLLPAILLLKDQRACVLLGFDWVENCAQVILPELSEQPVEITLDELEANYLGFGFLLRKRYNAALESGRQSSQVERGHWFWSAINRCRGLYLNVIFASLMVNIFVLATPLFTMNVYDRVVPNSALDTLWVLAAGIGIVFVLDLTLKFIRAYLLEIAAKKSDLLISARLFAHAMGLQLGSVPSRVGVFANTLKEFESIRSFLASATLLAVIDLPFTALFLFIIYIIGGPMVWVPLVSIILVISFSLLMAGPLHRAVERIYGAAANKNALLIESLSNLVSIRATGSNSFTQWQWQQATGEIADLSVRSHLLAGAITIFTALMLQLTTVGVVIAGVYQVFAQELSLGGMIAIVILSSRSLAPLAQLAGLITNYQQTKTAYQSLNELIAQPQDRPQDRQYTRKESFDEQLELKRASLVYPGTEQRALQGVTFTIRKGERVGVLGRVGSGKSSLGNLLLGLYQPTEGSLELDHHDYQHLDPVDIRRLIACQWQEPMLMRGTVRSNILQRDRHASDAEVARAAQIAGLDLFINRLPAGLDSEIGERGAGLSGGQRQCVSLARTLLTDAPILLLDEPTSAMDSGTEAVIRQRLKASLQERETTLILITHKSTMLELVDRLIVLDEGRLVLDGPRDQVLKQLAANTGGEAKR